MHTFTDAAGRLWRVTLDIAAAMRVDDANIRHRGETLVLTDPDRWFFRALMRSPKLQAQVLYQLCRPQAEEEGVCEADFQVLLLARVDDGAGDDTSVLAAGAIPALGLELSDFFQSCPTSTDRLLRALNSVRRMLQSALPAQEPDTAAANPTTTSSGLPPLPASTGAPPA